MVTGDPVTLCLVITGSAVITGFLLWLVKYFVDEDLSSSPADKSDQDEDQGQGQDEQPQLKWVLARVTTGEPLYTGPVCKPAPRPALSAAEPLLPITTPEPPHGRHRKGTHRCI
ncbi:hypothetical protein ACIQVC_37170 [Streptomyces sp. NPDC101112]|uniref:hypothetical protein n=1 Tax=Streptomyces sp. NPDC101112 TaxID=3366105 RepID=UPI00382D428F